MGNNNSGVLLLGLLALLYFATGQKKTDSGFEGGVSGFNRPYIVYNTLLDPNWKRKATDWRRNKGTIPDDSSKDEIKNYLGDTGLNGAIFTRPVDITPDKPLVNITNIDRITRSQDAAYTIMNDPKWIAQSMAFRKKYGTYKPKNEVKQEISTRTNPINYRQRMENME